MNQTKPKRPRRNQDPDKVVPMSSKEQAPLVTIEELLPFLADKFKIMANLQEKDKRNMQATGERIAQRAGYMQCLTDLHATLSPDEQE